MICDQCKGYIIRELAKCKGYIVHMAAYGCDRLSKEDKYCDRNELIKYALDENGCWHRYPDDKPETPASAREALDYLVIVETCFDGSISYDQDIYKFFAKEGFHESIHPNKQRWSKVIYWRELPPMPKEIKQ